MASARALAHRNFISLMGGTRGRARLYILRLCPALPDLSSAGACCLVRCVGAVPSFGTLHGYLCGDGVGDVPATDRSTPVIVAEGVLGCMWCTLTIGSMVVHKVIALSRTGAPLLT